MTEDRMARMFLGFGCISVMMTASLWFGGCTPPPVSRQQKLRPVYSVAVPADYETVYERIARRARQRYTFALHPTHQPGVSADLFLESQSATVTLWDSGGLGIRYRLSAQMRATGPTHTQVELRAAGKDDTREAQLWAVWASTPLEN